MLLRRARTASFPVVQLRLEPASSGARAGRAVRRPWPPEFEVPRAPRRIVERARPRRPHAPGPPTHRSRSSLLRLETSETTFVADKARPRAGATDVASLSLDQADSDLLRISFAAADKVARDQAVHGITERPDGAALKKPVDRGLAVDLLDRLAAQSAGKAGGDPRRLPHGRPSPRSARAMTFLLDHLPRQVHIVVTTPRDLHASPWLAYGPVASSSRSVPSTFASRVRRRPGAASIGSSFSTSTQTTRPSSRTRQEGWITALRLSCHLDPRPRRCAQRFVAAFKGTNRCVVDYLVDKMLARPGHDIGAFPAAHVSSRPPKRMRSATRSQADTTRTQCSNFADRAEKPVVDFRSTTSSATGLATGVCSADLLHAQLSLDERPDVAPGFLHSRASFVGLKRTGAKSWIQSVMRSQRTISGTRLASSRGPSPKSDIDKLT